MIIIKKTFLLIALIIIQQCAFAATYYVDSEHGNDLWSGQQPAPMGTNGPWQTLGRLAAAALLPGDTVYLGCGATWNETLRIGASGTRAAPIAIFAGPGTCETPPAIDGAVSIPSHMWKPYGGGIYRARLPMEYISNPGLSENVNGWAHWSPGLDASMSLDTACTGSPLPCMAFTSGAASGIAISNNFPLAGGINYSASVLVMAPAGTRMKFVTVCSTASYLNSKVFPRLRSSRTCFVPPATRWRAPGVWKVSAFWKCRTPSRISRLSSSISAQKKLHPKWLNC